MNKGKLNYGGWMRLGPDQFSVNFFLFLDISLKHLKFPKNYLKQTNFFHFWWRGGNSPS